MKILIPAVLALLGAAAHAQDEDDGPKAEPNQADAKKAAAKPATEAEKLYRAGEALFKKGQAAAEGRAPESDLEPSLKEALKTFETLAARFPKDENTPQGIYFMGSSCLLLDDFKRALTYYQRVHDEYPAFKDRAWALFRVGVCHAALDEPRKAWDIYQRVIREFPDKQAQVTRARKYLSEISLVGRPAPPISVPGWMNGIGGEEGLKTFRGEVIVLVFFATWCHSCEKEMPRIRSLMTRLGSRGVVFIGVANPEDPENKEKVEPYVRGKNLEFMDVALDPQEASWGPYRVSGFPAAVVIDRRGLVRWRGHPAFLSKALVEKLVLER